ncbi:Carbamoyl-phosphate synthase [Rhizina undulata]
MNDGSTTDTKLNQLLIELIGYQKFLTRHLTPESSISPSLAKLISRGLEFERRHILYVNQFSRSDLHRLFTVSQEMRLAVERSGSLDLLKGRLLCMLFFEPSTRTSASFDVAMKHLRGRTVVVNAAHWCLKNDESLLSATRCTISFCENCDVVSVIHTEPVGWSLLYLAADGDPTTQHKTIEEIIANNASDDIGWTGGEETYGSGFRARGYIYRDYDVEIYGQAGGGTTAVTFGNWRNKPTSANTQVVTIAWENDFRGEEESDGWDVEKDVDLIKMKGACFGNGGS